MLCGSAYFGHNTILSDKGTITLLACFSVLEGKNLMRSERIRETKGRSEVGCQSGLRAESPVDSQWDAIVMVL